MPPAAIPARSPQIRAIGEPGERLVEVEITVCCSRAGLRQDRPGEHPWYGQFRHQLRLAWNQGQMGSGPDGRIRMEVPRGQNVRAVCRGAAVRQGSFLVQ
jgi:hypothetical protein